MCIVYFFLLFFFWGGGLFCFVLFVCLFVFFCKFSAKGGILIQ